MILNLRDYLKKKRDRRDPLLRALGRPKNPLRILDATAGFIEDAFEMSRLGHSVTCLERLPSVFSIAQEALVQASKDPDLAGIVQRLNLNLADTRDYLSNSKESFDLVFLDPFFPKRSSKALPKKKMQLLQQLAQEGGDKSLVDAEEAQKDCLELLLLAKERALIKVVLKRSLSTPVLLRPQSQIFGTQIRFDLYLPSSKI
ncbi:MAG: class I SAM-dependent methyltransferase [Bdellovibrio sp.]